MKRVLFLAPIMITLISCNNKKNENLEQIEKQVSLKDSAISYLNKADSIVRKGIKKEISQDNVNSQITPLMDKYHKLMKKMPLIDSIEVHEYRIEQVNKLIDFQAENL